MWEVAKCKTFKDYLEIYLLINTLLLAEIFDNFRTHSIDAYKLDPSAFVSAPSLSMASNLHLSGSEIELIRDSTFSAMLKNNLRGGFVCLNTPYTKFNTPGTEGYDKNKPNSYGLFLDVNSLYATVMTSKLPDGKHETLTEDEVANFDFINTSATEEYSYFLLIDFNINEAKKFETDDFPLAIIKKTCTSADHSEYTKKL